MERVSWLWLGVALQAAILLAALSALYVLPDSVFAGIAAGIAINGFGAAAGGVFNIWRMNRHLAKLIKVINEATPRLPPMKSFDFVRAELISALASFGLALIPLTLALWLAR